MSGTLLHTELHRELHVKIGGFLKEAVFGFNDGLVSTFAVIAGLTGGVVEHKTVLLGALATLVAGAFSMGLGTYLGSKSEKELYESEKKREIYEMEHMPEIERQEIVDIYKAKGFRGELLEKVVAHIISDKKLWLDTMMREELGFAEAPPRPGMNGVVMAVAFTIGSCIAALPYFFSEISAPYFSTFSGTFLISLAVSILGLLTAGALKTHFTKRHFLKSALETLFIGTLAAAGSFGVGMLFTS